MNSFILEDEKTYMKTSDKTKHSRQCILLNNLRDNHEKKHRWLPKTFKNQIHKKHQRKQCH